MFDVLVSFRGKSCTLSFEHAPTYAQMKRAIQLDIVGSDSFTMSAKSLRGGQVQLKDAASFARVGGIEKRD